MTMTTALRARSLGLLLATAASLFSAAPSLASANDDGWRGCADEGSTCRVEGRALVRYGAEGRWVTRTVYGSVACSNDAFGDPAPEVPKRCQVRVSGHGEGAGQAGSGSAGWSFCAAEGEVCRFNGMSQVRFGQGDRFIIRNAYGSVRCDVADFGDPSYGVTKFCEVRSSAALSGGNSSSGSWAGWNNGQAGNWRYCAAEGGSCRVRGTAKVRFGDGRRFNTRTVTGEVDCKVDVFGDPAYNTLKHCEVQGNALDNGNTWSRCAREGERCSFTGTAQVRYGTQGRYVYRDARDGVSCDSRAFGSDPYFDKVKACEIRR